MFNKRMTRPEDPYILTPDCVNEFDQEHGIPVLRTRGHKNNATSPSVSFLNFEGIIIENKSNSAITVGQIFKELVARNIRERQNDERWACYAIYACDWIVCWYDSDKVIEQRHAGKHVKKACKDIVIDTLWYS
ncbi:hypothetical protein KCU65_g7549, partial [Aureobasidium melanogenum]